VLETAGLVKRQIRGREHWVSLQPDALTVAEQWLGEQTSFWARRAEALAQRLERTGGAPGPIPQHKPPWGARARPRRPLSSPTNGPPRPGWPSGCAPARPDASTRKQTPASAARCGSTSKKQAAPSGSAATT